MTGHVPDRDGIVQDYLELWNSRRHLHRAVLRTGSTDARELLLRKAFGGRVDAGMLQDALADPGLRQDLAGVVAQLPVEPVLTFARVVALQNVQADDRALGLLLYRAVVEAHGEHVLRGRNAKLAVDLALVLGDPMLAQRVLAAGEIAGLDEACARADLLNPFVRPGQDVDAWLSTLGWQFHADGVAPLRLLPESGEGPEPFDRLAAVECPAIAEGPLVTVVITTWCPGGEFTSAFRSITGQSWRNLEILVIDDCSPDGFQPFIGSVVAEDPRARLIRMPRNGGTYLARNRGLAEAQGALFTVHDSDDWAHPERIERQVAALMADPRLVSSSSRALRLDGNLAFTFPGVSASRENASSLMFWRSAACDAIGFYDPSRKGADTEYAVRLARHFGEGSHALLDRHLACIRLRTGSLSREEFKPGWRHPSRAAYRRGYLWWHQRAAERGEVLRSSGTAAGRRFPQPLPFMPGRDSAQARARRQWDVAYLLDARDSARKPAGYLAEMLALADAGARVALMHVESMLHPFVQEFEVFGGELQEMIARERIGEVLPTDELDVDTLVVRDPSCLQFGDGQPFPFKAARVLVVPDAMPSVRPRAFDCAHIDQEVRRRLGVEPMWLLPPGETPSAWPGIRAESRRWGPELIGRHLHRAPRTGAVWPVEELQLACISDQAGPELRGHWRKLAKDIDTRVRVLSGDRPRDVRAGRARISVGDVPDDLYFASVDMVLLQGDPSAPPMRRAAQLAAASGCIVLGDEGLWADELREPGLLAPQHACAERLRAMAADQGAVARNRRLARQWLLAAGGSGQLVRQLFRRHE